MGQHCLAQQQQPHALHKVPYSTYTPVTRLAGYDVTARDRRTHNTSIVISNTCLCNGVHLVQMTRWPKSSDSASMLQERLLLKGRVF